MKMPVDMFGTEIKVGDIVVYPVRQSSSMWMTMAVVLKMKKATKYVYNKRTEKREPTDYYYPIIQKYIDMPRIYWEGDGDMADKNIPEDAVFLREEEINPRAWPRTATDRKDSPVIYKLWEVKKGGFRNYALSCYDRAMVVEQWKARNFKPSFLDENQLNPYVERANEILTNGAKNEKIV